MKLGGRGSDREHILAHTGDVDAVGGVRSVVLDDGLRAESEALELPDRRWAPLRSADRPRNGHRRASGI